MLNDKNMKMELNVGDVEAIFQALKAWEEAPHHEGMLDAFLDCLAPPEPGQSKMESVKQNAERRRDVREREVKKRNEAVIMVRAKLFLLRNYLLEHQVEPEGEKPVQFAGGGIN